MTFALIQQAGGGNPLLTMWPLLGMLALFYFLIIRPQSQARKEQEARLAKLKAGDEVLLQGGLYGTIDRVEEKVIYVKLGNAIVKARRQAVAALAGENEPQA